MHARVTHNNLPKERILAHLRATTEEVTSAHELREALGYGLTTVRSNLKSLIRAGLVDQVVIDLDADMRGAPRDWYWATTPEGE